jgi:hypothetical protein
MSRQGFIRIYPMGRGLNGVIYKGEREDGTVVDGCVETANASSYASRLGALTDVMNRMKASGQFDDVLLPDRDEP